MVGKERRAGSLERTNVREATPWLIYIYKMSAYILIPYVKYKSHHDYRSTATDTGFAESYNSVERLSRYVPERVRTGLPGIIDLYLPCKAFRTNGHLPLAR